MMAMILKRCDYKANNYLQLLMYWNMPIAFLIDLEHKFSVNCDWDASDTNNKFNIFWTLPYMS